MTRPRNPCPRSSWIPALRRVAVLGATLGCAQVAHAGVSAGSLAIQDVSCRRQADNVLRFDCQVETNAPATVRIHLCDATIEGEGCEKRRMVKTPGGKRTTECAEGTACYRYDLTLFNLISGHDYEWEVVAIDGGGPVLYTPAAPDDVLTPDALPAPGLAAMSVAVESPGEPTVDYVLFNFGCSESSDGVRNSYLVITDTDGEVVWYQDPRVETGEDDAVIGGVQLTHPDEHILILDGKDRVMEYDLRGRIQTILDRDDGAFDDSEGTARFVHHDLMRQGDRTYLLTAREYDYVDVNDCDEDGRTDDVLTYILDGVIAYDHTVDPWAIDPSLEWSLADVYDPSDCSGPQPPRCTSTLWLSEGMDGCDWAHANSLWVDQHGKWLLSLKDQSKIIQVDGASGTLDWELSGDGTGADFVLDRAASIRNPFFDNQHHASFTPVPGHIVLYDNDEEGTADPRGLELVLSPSDGTYAVTQSWPTPPRTPRGDCNSKGSAYRMLDSGDVLATCAPAGDIWELDADGEPVWKMSVGCAEPYTTSGNLYRAVPIRLLP